LEYIYTYRYLSSRGFQILQFCPNNVCVFEGLERLLGRKGKTDGEERNMLERERMRTVLK